MRRLLRGGAIAFLALLLAAWAHDRGLAELITGGTRGSGSGGSGGDSGTGTTNILAMWINGAAGILGNSGFGQNVSALVAAGSTASVGGIGFNQAGNVEVIADGSTVVNAGLFGGTKSDFTLHDSTTENNFQFLIYNDADGIANGIVLSNYGSSPNNEFQLTFGDGAGGFATLVNLSKDHDSFQGTNFQFGAPGSTAITSPTGGYVNFDVSGSSSSPSGFSNTFRVGSGATSIALLSTALAALGTPNFAVGSATVSGTNSMVLNVGTAAYSLGVNNTFAVVRSAANQQYDNMIFAGRNNQTSMINFETANNAVGGISVVCAGDANGACGGAQTRGVASFDAQDATNIVTVSILTNPNVVKLTTNLTGAGTAPEFQWWTPGNLHSYVGLKAPDTTLSDNGVKLTLPSSAAAANGQPLVGAVVSASVTTLNFASGVTQNIAVCTGTACATKCILTIIGGLIITQPTGTCPSS